MTSREQFEAWAKAHFCENWMFKNSETLIAMSAAWKAARAGMVPKEEIEKALLEGANAVIDFTRPIENLWHGSRAKRVMEGEV